MEKNEELLNELNHSREYVKNKLFRKKDEIEKEEYNSLQSLFSEAFNECERAIKNEKNETKILKQCLEKARDNPGIISDLTISLITAFPPDKIPYQYYDIYPDMFLFLTATEDEQTKILLNLNLKTQARILEFEALVNVKDSLTVFNNTIPIQNLINIFTEIKNEYYMILIMQNLTSVKKLELLEFLLDEQQTTIWIYNNLIDLILKDENIPDELKSDAFGLLPEKSRTLKVYTSLTHNAQKKAAKHLPPSEVPNKFPYYEAIVAIILCAGAIFVGIALCFTAIGAITVAPLIVSGFMGLSFAIPSAVTGYEYFQLANQIKKYQKNISEENNFETELKDFKQAQQEKIEASKNEKIPQMENNSIEIEK